MKRVVAAIAVVVGAAALHPQIATGAPADVSTVVAKKAAILSGMHKKARKALVNAAQDRSFADYFQAHDDGHRHEMRRRIFEKD